MALLEKQDLSRYACVSCSSESIRPVLLLSRDGVPPGRPDHNIVYHHTVVVLCDSCGAGFVEVRKHDCFDFEDVWDQEEWYSFDRASADVLRSKLSICEQPLSESCSCPLHRSLRDTPLPVRTWTYGFEGNSHVQPVAIVLRRGLPCIVAATSSPDESGGGKSLEDASLPTGDSHRGEQLNRPGSIKSPIVRLLGTLIYSLRRWLQ